MAGQGGEPKRWDILLAIAHPLRRQILRRLNQCDEPASPVQLADDLEGALGRIAYHVRVLCRLDALSEAGEQQVPGVVERFYMSKVKDDPPIEMLLEEMWKEDEGEE